MVVTYASIQHKSLIKRSKIKW
ncbi:hypothetical protein ACJIZ3_023427 [Penstemon smallii]|uniref:Uncharacterized protein n=1 Tax=Penstemon smallii TaxID=265156 RepID=A0ABD3TP26_9LAMI